MADNQDLPPWASWSLLGGLTGLTGLGAYGAKKALPYLVRGAGMGTKMGLKYVGGPLADVAMIQGTTSPTEDADFQRFLQSRLHGGQGLQNAGTNLGAMAAPSPSPQPAAPAPPQLGPALSSAFGQLRAAAPAPAPTPAPVPPQAPVQPQQRMSPLLPSGAPGSIDIPPASPSDVAAHSIAYARAMPLPHQVGNPFAGFMSLFGNKSNNNGYVPPDFQLMGR